MRHKRSILFSLTLFCFSGYLAAQPWSGLISSTRAADWTNAGIAGGVPNRTTNCATFNPGATAAQINAAIQNCASGQVVYLNAGTYSLSGMIDFAGKNNVTLRGAGPDSTILQFTSGAPDGCGGPAADVCIQGSFNWNGGPQNSANWTAGYAQGATQITLSSTSGLSVGQILILDQDNDALDTGQVFVCDNNFADSAHTDCASDTGAPGRNMNGIDRNQQQYVKVTAISGNTVSISPGLYMPNWRSSQKPGAFWANAVINSSGIENLTLDHTQAAPNMVSGLMFWNAYQCWMKNIKSIEGNRNHVWLEYSAKVVIRDSYFWGTLNSATMSYGVEPWQSGDLLIENNIFDSVVTPILIGNTSGSVFSFNYGVNNTTFASNQAWQMPGPAWVHDGGTSMNLVEGNEGTGLIMDAIHGTNNFFTVFRNRYTGLQTGRSQQTVPIILQAHSRYTNIIGNVLGTPGYHNNYQSANPTASSCDSSIYNLGWSSSVCSNDANIGGDTLVASTMMRWGNYDTAHSAVQWVTSEIPSVLGLFANVIPTLQVLPNSFYLSGKPGFWGSTPWPAIGPDVNGGSDPTGKSFPIPAHNCYNATSKNSSGVLNFNANNCYGSSTSTPTPPAPPTNVTAVIK